MAAPLAGSSRSLLSFCSSSVTIYLPFRGPLRQQTNNRNHYDQYHKIYCNTIKVWLQHFSPFIAILFCPSQPSRARGKKKAPFPLRKECLWWTIQDLNWKSSCYPIPTDSTICRKHKAFWIRPFYLMPFHSRSFFAVKGKIRENISSCCAEYVRCFLTELQKQGRFQMRIGTKTNSVNWRNFWLPAFCEGALGNGGSQLNLYGFSGGVSQFEAIIKGSFLHCIPRHGQG